MALVVFTQWHFLPHFNDTIFDTGILRGTDDKMNELTRVRGIASRPLGEVFQGRGHNNVLPAVVTNALSAVLPLITAYNLIIFLIWPLGAWAVYLLSRELGANLMGGLMAGIFFALAQPVWDLIQYDSLDYGMIFWCPLLVFFLLRVRASRQARWCVGAALCIVGVGLTNYYYLLVCAVFGALLLAHTLLPGLWPWQRAEPGAGRPALRLSLAAAAGILVLLPSLIAEGQFLEQIRGHEIGLRSLGMLEPGHGVITSLSTYLLLSSWSMIPGAFMLASLLIRSGRWRQRLFLAMAGIIIIVAISTLRNNADYLARWIERLPALWRMYRLETMAVLPLSLFCALGGWGLSAILAWNEGAAAKVINWICLAAILVFSIIQYGWGRADLARQTPHFELPRPLTRILQETAPEREVLLLNTSPIYQTVIALKFYIPYLTGRREHLLEDGLRRGLLADLFPDGGWAPNPPGPSRAGAAIPSREILRAHLNKACPVVVVHINQAAAEDRLEPYKAALKERMGLKICWSNGSWIIARPGGCAGCGATRGL